jgi:predicted AlkP superfamily phosphohydrolase/phosphomutase
MSDHGFGGNNTKAIYLNRWLESIGMLHFVDSPGALSVRGLAMGAGARLLREGISLAKKWLPRKFKNRLRQAPRMRATVEAAMRHFGVDWSRTRAYSDELRGNLWINVKGREPGGIVEPGREYEEVRDTLIQNLKELRDPGTGEPIVGQVFKREEIYRGPYVERAPDVVFLQAGYLSRDHGPYNYVYRRSRTSSGQAWLQEFSVGQLEWDVRPHASHRLDGLLILNGLGIGAPKEIEGAQIIDVAPTVLHLLGLPVPQDMDGRVMVEALEPSYLSVHPVQTGAPTDEEGSAAFEYSSEEIQKVEESLRALGYID